MFRFHLSADWSKDRFYGFTEQVVQRRLERLDGVAQVEVRGIHKGELQIQLVPARMQAAGVDVREVPAVLRGNHVNVSGGYVKEGSRKLVVRSVGEFRSLEEIQKLPIRPGIRVGDVATVAYTYSRQDEFNFLNHQEAVTLSVFKSSTANLLAVVDSVKEELERIRKVPQARASPPGSSRTPPSTSATVWVSFATRVSSAGSSRSSSSSSSSRKCERRSSSRSSIPTSIVLTFVILYFLRQAGAVDTTLNIISLMGLMLAVGMLVDNSIVVLESIQRKREQGLSVGEAARTGASEVGQAVIASTITTVCVFVPIVFVEGVAGQLFGDQALTVTYSLAVSLIVALTLIPMLASREFGNEPPDGAPAHERSRVGRAAVAFVEIVSLGSLGWSRGSLRDSPGSFSPSCSCPPRFSTFSTAA